MRRLKLSEENVENFTVRGCFAKNATLHTKFSDLSTSGRHNSAMITDHPKLTTKIASTRCIVLIFTVRINSNSFPWDVRRIQGTYFPHFGQHPMSYNW